MRVYFAALVGAAIFLAYVTGVHVGNVRCGERVANANMEQVIYNAKIMGDTNAAVMHTGVRDIRRLLHERYTIAE